MYRPSDNFYAEFVTSSSTGAATNADSLPAATANHNGTDDGSFTLTVANLDTGRYKITGTVPAGYAAGDKISVSVSASIGGIAAKAIIGSYDVAETNAGYPAIDAAGKVLLQGTQTANITGNLSGSVGSVTGSVGSVSGSVASVTNPVTVGTNNDKSGYALSSSQTFNVTGNLSGSVGSVSGSVASVTGNVGGNLVGNVQGTVPDSAGVVTLLPQIVQILGLVGHNSGIRNEVYDGNGNLTSADICAYDNATDAVTNDGSTGLVHKWTLASVYSGTQQTSQSVKFVS